MKLRGKVTSGPLAGPVMRMRLFWRKAIFGRWWSLRVAGLFGGLPALMMVAGCSVLIAHFHERRARNAAYVIQVGTPRSEIVSALGAPQSSQQSGEKLTETYFIPPHVSEPIEFDTDQIKADLFYCLGCPIEVLTTITAVVAYRQNKCEYRLTYGEDERLEGYRCFARLRRPFDPMHPSGFYCPLDCAQTDDYIDAPAAAR